MLYSRAVRRNGGLFRNRGFGIFWVGQTMSMLGDALSAIALPLLVLATTGSVVQMGLLTAVIAAGTIGTGIFAGVIVDRVNRRRLMIWTDLGRAALHAMIPLVWLAGPQLWVLYAGALLSACLSMLFQVAYVTAIPQLVEPSRITAANGWLRASMGTTAMVGPALAGLLAAVVGPAGVVGLDGVTFLASAAAIALIRFGSDVPSKTEAGPQSGRRLEWRRVSERFLAGARFLWASPVLRWLTILLTLFIFVTAGLDDILIYYLRHDLRQGSQVVGLVLGVASLGAIVSALLAAWLRRLIGFGFSWLIAICVVGAAITVIGLATSPLPVALLAAAMQAGITLGGVMSMSVRQELTPDRLLGRVTAAFWTIHYSAAPLGAALLTVLAGVLGVATTGVLAGLVCVAIAAVGLFTPLRGARPEAATTLSANIPGDTPSAHFATPERPSKSL